MCRRKELFCRDLSDPNSKEGDPAHRIDLFLNPYDLLMGVSVGTEKDLVSLGLEYIGEEDTQRVASEESNRVMLDIGKHSNRIFNILVDAKTDEPDDIIALLLAVLERQKKAKKAKLPEYYDMAKRIVSTHVAKLMEEDRRSR